jgi:hypothetical protein
VKAAGYDLHWVFACPVQPLRSAVGAVAWIF